MRDYGGYSVQGGRLVMPEVLAGAVTPVGDALRVARAVGASRILVAEGRALVEGPGSESWTIGDTLAVLAIAGPARELPPRAALDGYLERQGLRPLDSVMIVELGGRRRLTALVPYAFEESPRCGGRVRFTPRPRERCR